MDAIRLSALYPAAELPAQRARYTQAIEYFENQFGKKEVSLFSAPGRSELCGNHTDHQKGNVLACAIEKDAIAVAARRADDRVHLLSEGCGTFSVSINDLQKRPEEAGTTAALLRGTLAGLERRNFSVGGAEIYVESDVLPGSGLSSSAAFEVLLGAVFSGLYNENALSPLTLAQIGQEAEAEYFGKPCGLLDQLTCATGGLVQIDFGADIPKVRKLSADFSQFGYALCLTDTRTSHAGLTDAYAAIPKEMGEIAAHFGKEYLSQVPENTFYAAIPALRDTCGDRAVTRAIHFFSETKRAVLAANALEGGDFPKFLDIIKASGASSHKYLQNITVPGQNREQGLSLGLCVSEEILGNRGVCRVHGGGFAGTMQAFVKDEFVPVYKTHMHKLFGEGTCLQTSVRPVGVTAVIL